jgi:hypothetical protein
MSQPIVLLGQNSWIKGWFRCILVKDSRVYENCFWVPEAMLLWLISAPQGTFPPGGGFLSSHTFNVGYPERDDHEGNHSEHFPEWNARCALYTAWMK